MDNKFSHLTIEIKDNHERASKLHINIEEYTVRKNRKSKNECILEINRKKYVLPQFYSFYIVYLLSIF